MVLETKRLLLREMKPDDYQALFRVLGSPETIANIRMKQMERPMSRLFQGKNG